MDQNDPEKRIAELERQLAEQKRMAELEHQHAEPAKRPVVTPEQVRNVAFSKPSRGKRGYNEDEVDAFVDLVDAARRDATGHTLTPEQVRNTAFSKPPLGKRGYNEDEVDAFLDRIEQEMRRRATGANQGSEQLAFTPSPPAGITPPPGPPTHRTVDSRLARGGRLLAALVFGLFGLSVIAWAGCGLWAGHSGGIRARVDIADCGKTSIFGPMKGPGGSFTRDCSAVWRPADGSEQMVTVHFVRHPHEGQTVDVHIHGDQAYTNSGWVIVYLVLGIVFLGTMFLPVWLGRRSRASRPSRASRGRHEAPRSGDAHGPQDLS
jgi:DivIVA domain-containing protein